MYTVELYARVRRAVQVEGKSERQVALLAVLERFGRSFARIDVREEERKHSGN